MYYDDGSLPLINIITAILFVVAVCTFFVNSMNDIMFGSIKGELLGYK